MDTHPLVAWAEGELGTEEATGANDGPRILEYLTLPGHPDPEAELGADWCAAFVMRGLWEVGNPWHKEPADFYEGRKVKAFVAQARRWGRYRKHDYRPRPGDLVILRRRDHVGIVTGHDARGFIETIEGNRSNMVARSNYSPLDGRVVGFARL